MLFLSPLRLFLFSPFLFTYLGAGGAAACALWAWVQVRWGLDQMPALITALASLLVGVTPVIQILVKARQEGLQDKLMVLQTRLMSVEGEVEQERALVGALVGSKNYAVVTKDLNGIIQTWNRGATEIFGYREREMLGKNISVLIPPERLSEEEAIRKNLAEGKRVEQFRSFRRHKNGSMIRVVITVTPIRDALGQVVGACNVARPFTPGYDSAMDSMIMEQSPVSQTTKKG
jgi:PAS domain S-box-containing protein